MSRAFGAQSTTDEVLEGLDLTGKDVLVTGVSAGLGVETARALIAHGAHVVGTARNLDKARAATAHIGDGGGRFEIKELDLASLTSVRACADALLADGRTFDVVIANAGVMACPQGKTADGFETQFGTNHLGHFVLVNRILPLFKPGSRFVSVSSSAHRGSDVDLEDPDFEHTPYEEWKAYGRSKTANVHFALEFDRRHRDDGIRATSLHPGGILTELGRHIPPDTMKAIVASVEKAAADSGKPGLAWKTIPQGAATSVWAGLVADANEVAAHFCEDCQVAPINDDPESRSGVRSYALDPEKAKATWAMSEKMVGERF